MLLGVKCGALHECLDGGIPLLGAQRRHAGVKGVVEFLVLLHRLRLRLYLLFKRGLLLRRHFAGQVLVDLARLGRLRHFGLRLLLPRRLLS